MLCFLLYICNFLLGVFVRGYFSAHLVFNVWVRVPGSADGRGISSKRVMMCHEGQHIIVAFHPNNL